MITLPAFAAERRRPQLGARSAPAAAAIDRYILLTWRSAASPPAAVAAVNRWDRHTDGRTPDRYIDPAPQKYRLISTYIRDTVGNSI